MRTRQLRSIIVPLLLTALAGVLLAGCTSTPQQSTSPPNATNDTQNSTNVTPTNATLVTPTLFGPVTSTPAVAPSPGIQAPYNYGP